MKHIQYRPDIDGLRAIAILSVIGFHFFPGKIQGGFVGVDIFFVISGFLISSIIIKDLERNSFNYIDFYCRRIKRIFPALILVATMAWLFGWLVLFPYEFEQLGKHTAGGIGFISNFILWSEAGYFDVSSETKPLLHLWSLGIEEQFYFFWPLLLGLAWKKKFNFLSITLLIAITSFCANLNSPTSASMFYLPINRFWEMMIGGILSYITLHKKDLLLTGKFYSNVQSSLGAFLIIVAIFFLDRNKTFPGWWALLPSMGAFLIILSPASWINRSILGNQILVYIGLISYPLYLWHWPILSYAHILGYTSREVKVVLVVLSVTLAWLTYEFIENKVRKYSSFHSVYILILLSFTLICLGLISWGKMVAPRNNSHRAYIASKAIDDWEYPDGLTPFSINNVDVYIKNGAKEKVIFFGDSHIEQYAPRIVKLINQDPINTKTVIFATRAACPPIPNVYEDHNPKCNDNFKETIIKYALSPEIDSVVIGTSSYYLIKGKTLAKGDRRYNYYYLHGKNKKYFNEDGINFAFQSLERLISSISQHKKVFLVIDNPTGSSFDPKAFFSGTRIVGTDDVENKINYQEYDKKQAEVRRTLLEIAERSNAIVIDPIEYLCVDNQCRTSLEDGTPIYKDSSHIRSSYVKQFIEYLDITVKK